MVEVNYLAVLVAAVVSFAIGGAWYSPGLFAKQWMKAINITPSGEKKGMGKSMGSMFVSLLVTAYVLAHFVYYVNASTAMAGAQLGFWVWLGITAMYTITVVSFERRSMTWYWITNGYQLLSLVVKSMILAVWL